jgi:hypothetical protein
VSVPSLDRLRLQGAGNIPVTGIDSRRLTVALPGSGNIHATGTTARLDVTAPARHAGRHRERRDRRRMSSIVEPILTRPRTA